MTIVTNDNLVFLIDIGVNGANIMVGNHSIATLLQKKRCLRHNIYLCEEKASEIFLDRTVSFKRIIEYKNLYLQLKNGVSNKILKKS